VEACGELGTVALPLPRLVAYQWLIYMEFDLHLWMRFDEVRAACAQFTLAAKERYQQASLRKRRAPPPPAPPAPPAPGLRGEHESMRGGRGGRARGRADGRAGGRRAGGPAQSMML
jgi:hypothetical protein